MRKILIPTDFSKTSKNAYHYALQLYGNTASKFDVVHIYHTSFDPSQPTVLDFSLGIDKIKKENIDRFIEDIPRPILNDLTDKPEIKGKVIMGFAAEQLITMSKDYDVIIMGTTGAHKLADKLFGTISLEVSRKAHCPVFLIPDGSKFISFNNIVYACDFEGVSVQILDKIVNFAQRFDAQVHFIHVSQEGSSIDISTSIQQMNFPITYSTKTIKAGSVSEGLNDFVENHNVELLIMATKKRSFWEQIIHRSITKKMAINSTVPLLVYHE
jgi:nucleotide-binding universal stress UspA family protein